MFDTCMTTLVEMVCKHYSSLFTFTMISKLGYIDFLCNNYNVYFYVIALILYTVTQVMHWNLTHKKEWRVYENGVGKKIVGHSKLKLWTFFWGQGEQEWP